MKREDVEKLLGDLEEDARKSVIDKVMELHGKDIESFKSKVETAENSTKDIQTQLDKANETIKSFENMKPEETKAEVEKWKTEAAKFQQEAEQAKKDADARVAKIEYDNALNEALKSAKVKDPKEILPHLDMETIVYKDGKFTGLEDQLKSLQESKEYLFNSENPEPKIVTKTNGGGGLAMSAVEAAMWKGAGMKPPTNE